MIKLCFEIHRVQNKLEGGSVDIGGPVRRLLPYPRKLKMVP